MHRFEDSLTVERFWSAGLDRWLRTRYVVRNATQNEEWSGIDRFVSDSRGECSIDYKCCQEARKTENAFIETVSNDITERPGWALTSKADWILYFVVPHEALFLRTLRLRDELGNWLRYPTGSALNRDYSTTGLLVPLPVVRALSEFISSPRTGEPPVLTRNVVDQLKLPFS